MAAKSAFEWEAHCGTITSHFEGLLSEWQSANSALIDENESLKSAIETHNILPEVEVDDEEDDFMAEGPMKGIVDLKVVETVHPAAVESAVLAELKLKRTDAMIQIFNKRLQHQEKRYAQTKAFQIMKLNCYLQVQNKFYKLKCASYLQDKEAELRRQYNDRPKDPITPKKVSTPPASVPTDVVEKPPSVKTKSVNRVTSLIVVRFPHKINLFNFNNIFMVSLFLFFVYVACVWAGRIVACTTSDRSLVFARYWDSPNRLTRLPYNRRLYITI